MQLYVKPSRALAAADPLHQSCQGGHLAGADKKKLCTDSKPYAACGTVWSPRSSARPH
jgi:hypothetical protein